MSGHTPGPWRAGKVGGCVVSDHSVRAGGGHDDVEYYGGHLIAESIARKADVALIAAAPDMLEALEEITGLKGEGDFMLMLRAQAAARRALAKVEASGK